jgi:CRP-like cAMP-binding protein
MDQTDQLIAQHPFFKEFSAEHQALLRADATFTRYDAGQQLFKEGEPADRFFLVHWGHISLETFVPGRGILTIQTLGHGDVLGWSWLFPPYRWHFGAQALEPVEVTVFSAEKLKARASEDPRFGYELVGRMAFVLLQRLQATRLQLIEFYDVRD